MHCRLKPRLNRSMKPTSWLFPEPCDGLGRHGFTFIDVGAGPSSASSTLATGPFVHLGSWCLSSDAGDCVPLTQAPPRQVYPWLDRPNQVVPHLSVGWHRQAARLPAELGIPTGDTRSGTDPHPWAPAPPHLPVGLSPVPEMDGVSGPRGSAASRGSPPTQSVHLRVFHVAHLPVHIVDRHRHPHPPYRSASVAEVSGTGGESVPSATSHNRTVPSRLPLARVRPSGLKATLVTQSA